jgi:HEPN domain-containing protein
MQWGAETYRRGAIERLADARILSDRRSYAFSMYAAGLAVEGMLRSIHWLGSREFDERHDLKKIAVRIESLGLLPAGGRDSDFVSTIQRVARRWSNALRFADFDQLRRFLWSIGELRRRDEGEIRRICMEHYGLCTQVVKRREILLRRNRGGKV